MAEEKKKQKQKPGVRTKLNSGDKKVQTNTDKNSKQTMVAKPNPTAVSAYKALPSMKLSKENWAEETSKSILSAVTPVSSERSLGENKVVPVSDTPLPVVPEVQEVVPVVVPEKETKKNKYKKKKEKKTSIIDDIKASITQGFDSVKIDYDQLSQIQNELHIAKDGVKSSITEGVSRLKDYANSAVESAAAATEEMKKKQKELADAADKKIKAEVQRIEKEKKKKAAETSKQKTKAAPTVSAEELAAAAAAAKPVDASEEEKIRLQKLNQAIQRRDGAKNALSALNTQLQYASPEQKKGLKERIKQKEQQLADAEAAIAELEQ
ncbi:MAG: hypothetical protein VZR09_00605 [Candidatus Gastranaerophilaceae bacterium]|nr:hypothetical protein [Candidatus Gastranaerophilaceae bacterium]